MCREYLTQLRERINEFNDRGVAVYAVAPSNAKFISQFLDAFGPFPFPILGDPEKEGYRQMGHKTMPKWKLLSKAALGFVLRKTKNFIPSDERQKAVVLQSMKKADVFIQGGTYLYSEDGKLFWKHVDSSPDDHAKIDTVLGKL
ncbi:peroxiredoxin-like family protein [Pseudalkalibacillus decolorationis]|uniref:peroxiredoxin-like family protein n=1 Tax=Pseudalkalibacillus decolorationis TaxID=163879 RepID=UPI00214940C1|nr:peroxiredoxin-like family protein [Pseudalkalibacillus decolorationis]